MLANALLVLQGIMLTLLLAVCGNTANLMLARASARQREIGVRLALGASRARIATLLLTENLMLASGGVVLGAIIAAWGTTALRAVPIIGSFPIRFQTDLDLVSLAFAAGLGVLCGLVFGGGPALQLARVDPQTAIRSGVASSGRSGIRHMLMAAEVGLALLVLLAAGAFIRGFSDARDTDPGFTREGVLLAAYDLGGRGLHDAAGPRLHAPSARTAARAAGRRERGHRRRRAARHPRSPVALVHARRPPRADGSADQALTNTVTPGYFKTMGIPLLHGADFADLGDPTRPPQAIVNEEFVRRFVGEGEALGRRVTTRNTDYAIAGVVRNSFSESFGEPPTPVVYLSYRDRPSGRGEMHLRTRAGAEPLLGPEVERVVRDLDPQLPVYTSAR